MKHIIGKILMWIVIIGVISVAMFYAYESGSDKTSYEKLSESQRNIVDAQKLEFDGLEKVDQINYIHSESMKKTNKIECLTIVSFCETNARFKGACDNCKKYTQEYIENKYN